MRRSGAMCRLIYRTGVRIVGWVGDAVRLWWNGRWGRIAQRRVRLYREPENGDRPWQVEAQAGDSDGPTQSWRFACEPDALDWVQHLLATDGGESWRPITFSRHPQSG